MREGTLHQINVAIAVAGAAILALGLISARVESWPVSRPLLALGIGVLAGPEVLGWLAIHEWPNSDTILKEAARFTLAISVFGIAIRTPREAYRRLLRPVGLLLTLGMTAMWLASAGLAWALLGLSPLVALLLGAVVTPTDPVVASSIVTGGLAERSLPDRVRSTLSLESGANDGLAYLIVLLPILLLTSPASEGIGRWFVEAVLTGVLLALVVGAAIGYGVARLLCRADARGWIEKHSFLGLSVALSLAVVAGTKLLGSDGILAAFAAGAAFNFGADRREDFKEQNVQETISKLFNLPIFVLLGAMLPWAAWAEIGWPSLAFSLAVLVVRRPAGVAAAALGRCGLSRPDMLFLGWFGPVGVAAIYYSLHASERTHDQIYWHVASLAIVVSIVAHGVTSAPGLAAHERASR